MLMENIYNRTWREMIEVKDYRCAVEAGNFAYQKQHDIPCLLVYVSFQRDRCQTPALKPFQTACLPRPHNPRSTEATPAGVQTA